MEEQWKEIEGYDGFYEVSNKGRVRSWHYTGNKNKDGTYNKADTPTIIKPYVKDGYYNIRLSKNGIRKQTGLHRLIAEAFIANPEDKPCINHIDCNPSNNSIDNLEWCTYSENIRHAHKNGRVNLPIGEEHHNSKLDSNDVKHIRSKYKSGNYSQRELAKIYHVDQRNIWQIVNNKTWTHV